MRVFSKFRLLIFFIGTYLWELTESNLQVAFDVIVPKEYYHPGMITLPIETTSEVQAVILANLITMTPGTICTDYRPDTKELEIHLMYIDQKEKITKRINEVYVPFIREFVP